jgi:pimeloyl-ACP methyl ester carboxylesterase
MEEQGIGVFHSSPSRWQYAIKPLITTREYTLSDKYGVLVGSWNMLKAPVNAEMFATNVMETIPELDVSVYIMQGRYDRVASYELAQRYYGILKAPQKGFYTFENSAHSPHMEEPQRLMQIIKDDILCV